MAKNKSVSFGDIIVDPDTSIKYAVISVTTSINKRKYYLILLEVNDAHDSIGMLPKPHDKLSIAKFSYVNNNAKHIKSYLVAMKIIFNDTEIKDKQFFVKK